MLRLTLGLSWMPDPEVCHNWRKKTSVSAALEPQLGQYIKSPPFISFTCSDGNDLVEVYHILYRKYINFKQNKNVRSREWTYHPQLLLPFELSHVFVDQIVYYGDGNCSLA